MKPKKFPILERNLLCPHHAAAGGDGWSGLIYLYPLFGIPAFGALPITIDGLIYVCKGIWKLLCKVKPVKK